jgi:hypothetical protein
MHSPLRPWIVGSACALAWGASAAVQADPARFDLSGPTLEMKVTRGGTTLPAAEVPNLVVGDRVWLKADLPPEQAAPYILIAAFLRGSTNPPPAKWFSRCDTWTEKCARQGMTLTVPKDAGQLLVFLAPETGGDFKTLVDAVRGRPGVFVRTSQDLNQATLDRARLERYLAAVRRLDQTDPAQLKEAAPLLARSFAMKLDESCLQKIPELQAACVMQGRESLIMDDGHSVSLTQALTSGPASDLAMEASNTAQLRAGYYGPYIGSIFDIARLFDSFHTAQYQYIAALATAQGQRLALVLNAPPSFHDPKSVLVVALPAVAGPQFPPLRPVDAAQSYCARKDPLVLPVEGAPLVFSTGYARDMMLAVTAADGRVLELPAHADAERGGIVADTSALAPARLADSAHASLHGYWGFDPYQGPVFRLAGARAQPWQLLAGDEGTLIVGRVDTAHLRAGDVSCLDSITMQDAAGGKHPLEWKTVKPDEVEIKLPLQDVPAGDLTLTVRQFGVGTPQSLTLRTFAEAAHLDSFVLHAGDADGTLRGNRLDEVQGLTLKGLQFAPGALTSSAGNDELVMSTPDAQAADALRYGDTSQAKVTLKDGRVVDLKVSVEAPRPSAMLIAKSARPVADSGNIQLASADELPQESQLTFALRARTPSAFAPGEQVEVATADGSFSAVLGAVTGGLTFENSRVAIATLDPARALGPAAYGPLRYRVVDAGVAGDWRPLATLVRLPVLRQLECPPQPASACMLVGNNLFLLAAVSDEPQFRRPVTVPDGFAGQEIAVPHPSGPQLYVKLRDDPSTVNIAHLDVQTQAAPPSRTAPAEPPPASPPASSPPSTPSPSRSSSPPALPSATPAPASPSSTPSPPAPALTPHAGG